MISAPGKSPFRMFLLLGFSLACLGSAACAPSPKTASSDACPVDITRTSTTEVSVCGHLTKDLVDRLLTRLDGSVREITIFSPGGSSVEAIRLAERMDEDNINLRVRGLCASACAHFLFLPAKHVIVEPGSVVLFHHTDSAVAAAAQRAGLTIGAETAANVERERRFFVDQGLPVEMLIDPLVRIEPVCASRLSDNRLYVATLLRTYVPSRDIIDGLRENPMEGYWPLSSSEAGPIAEQIEPNSVPLVFGGESEFQVLDNNVSIPVCPKDFLS